MKDSNPAGRCRKCGERVNFRDEYCRRCGAKNDNWVVPDQTLCGNCHAPLDGEKYCRRCGARAGEGRFEPYQQVVQCIYGPMPVERTHTCRRCGYSWTTVLMIDRDKFCPKCGGDAPADK